MVEAVRQDPLAASENAVGATCEARSKLSMPFARHFLPLASTRKCVWSSWIE